jgi:enoyl-CoA hydratase/carnithine racemase
MSDVAETLEGGVLELTLARPAKKNALTGAMYAQITAAFARAQADPAVAAVLIAAEGADFCAGNDLHDFLGSGGVSPHGPIMQFLHALARLEVPLVAAVQGRAVGVGATLLLHCDLVAAAPDASLTMPFVSLGLPPEAGSSRLLPALVGHRIAAEMVLLGRPLSAERALQLGLINEIADDPLGAARALAQDLARQPPGAVRAAKRLLRREADSLPERIDREAEIFAAALSTPEFQARAMAVLGKSTPSP